MDWWSASQERLLWWLRERRARHHASARESGLLTRKTIDLRIVGLSGTTLYVDTRNVGTVYIRRTTWGVPRRGMPGMLSLGGLKTGATRLLLRRHVLRFGVCRRAERATVRWYSIMIPVRHVYFYKRDRQTLAS